MGNHAKPAGDLFKNQEEQSGEVHHSEGTRKAGAAQKSARTKKSAAAFRTISEVANDLGVQQHVLRFWETKFTQVKPLKRGGGRRYYRPEDISLLEAIHHLLYVEGYTIKGVQKLLRDIGKKQIVANFSGDVDKDPSLSLKNISTEEGGQAIVERSSLTDQQREGLKSVLAELKELRGMIKPRR